LDISSRHFDNVAVVSPVGRIDHSTAPSFEPVLASYWANPATAGLVLDFSKVTYISSVGLRVLMIAAKQMRGRRARIAVTGLQPIVAEIFSISRFDAVLETFPGVRDAVAAISSEALAAYDAA
jgi:anti-anti-sigma factor